MEANRVVNSDHPVRRRRTTPEQKRADILDAAAAVFFERGFAASSIDMIIERVGGSKRAIYKEFGNKEALFAALVTEIADGALAALDTPDSKSAALDTVLTRFARSLLTIYTTPKLIGLYRAVVTEAVRFPDLASAFFDKGPGRATTRLEGILDAAHARGEIKAIDAKLAADHFIGMLRDNLHLQVVLCLRPPPDAAEIEARAAAAVTIFLTGIQAPGHQKGKRAR